MQDGYYRIQKDEVDRLLYSKTLEEIPRDLPIVAMMTCAEADVACPAIFGAVARIPWRYPDPKVSDGTAESAATYHRVANAIEADLQDLVNQTNSAQ
jgi:protein-tyrosine-phosphatase